MTGQESIRSNYPSYMESSIVLQKHKAAIQQSEKKPPHPEFPHPVPSPYAPFTPIPRCSFSRICLLRPSGILRC